MARQVKVFKIEETEPKERLPFQVEAKRLGKDEPEIYAFEAYGEPPSAAFLKLQEFIRRDDHGDRTLDWATMLPFFKLVMPAEDFKRLRELIEDPVLLVKMETIMEIYNWVIEEYYGFPTQRSSTSSDGRSTTGTGSTEPLPSEASGT